MEKINTKDTKAEIIKKYNDLVKEFKANGSASPKLERSGNGATPEVVLSEIASLKLDISKALEIIETKLLGKTTELRNIDRDIAEATSSLKLLHDITAEAESVDALVLAQDKQTKEFETKMENIIRGWRREEEEHTYNWNKEKRRRATEMTQERQEFDSKLSEERRKHDEYIASQLHEIDQGKNTISELEETISSLKTKHEKDIFSQKISITDDITERMTNKYETELQILENKIESLNGIIDDLRNVNASLGKSLEEANSRASAIAQEAVKNTKVIHMSERA